MHDTIQWIITLIESSKHVGPVKEQILYTVAEIMQKSDKQSPLKVVFREMGGITSILAILKSKDVEYSKDVLYAALYALGEVVTDSESNKSYLSELLPPSAITSLLKTSNVTLDVPLFLMIIELACVGSIRLALSVGSIDKINHSSTGKSKFVDELI